MAKGVKHGHGRFLKQQAHWAHGQRRRVQGKRPGPVRRPGSRQEVGLAIGLRTRLELWVDTGRRYWVAICRERH
jgi:hypothetical protein